MVLLGQNGQEIHRMAEISLVLYTTYCELEVYKVSQLLCRNFCKRCFTSV
jgi:hypothetical protein